VTHSIQARDLVQRAAELLKVDDAVAITVAALKAQATPERVQALVKQETGMGWIVEQWKPHSGAVMARAPVREGQAVVRYANTSANNASIVESFLLHDGKELEHRRYLVGKVVDVGDAATNGRKVTVKLDSSAEPMVFTLPEGKLAPAVGSQFVAVEKKPGELSYFQEVDGVVQKLSATMRSDQSGAAPSTGAATGATDGALNAAAPPSAGAKK